MKKLSFFSAMLALVLVFGLAFVSCDNGTTNEPEPGTFILTDIPEQYNGKYVFFSTSGNAAASLNGYESGGPYDDRVEFLTPFQAPVILCKVNDGKVVIPLWHRRENRRYTGNDTFVTNAIPTGSGSYEISTRISVTIYEQATISARYEENSGQLNNIFFESVTFSNGIATKSYNDRYEFWQ